MDEIATFGVDDNTEQLDDFGHKWVRKPVCPDGWVVVDGGCQPAAEAQGQGGCQWSGPARWATP